MTKPGSKLNLLKMFTAGSKPKFWAKIALRAVGIILFFLAIWMAATEFHWSEIFSHNPLWLCMVLVAVLINCGLSALTLFLVTRTFKPNPPITYGAMCRLQFAGALLNYAAIFVPAGLFYRVGYLKAKHGVPLTASGKTVVFMVSSAALACVLLLIAILIGYGWLFFSLALILWSIFMRSVWSQFAPDAAAGYTRLWPIVRVFEIAFHGVRVWFSFKAIGQDIPLSDAIGIGTLSVLIGLASGIPSSLGIREWAVGLSASLLNVANGPAGLAAALVDRACEVLIYLLVGGPVVYFGISAQPADIKPESTP